MKFYNFKKIFNNFLSNESHQLRLTKINLILAILSSIFIYFIYRDIQEILTLRYTFNILEIVVLLSNYILGIKIWQKFSHNNYGENFGKDYSHWAFSRIGRYIPGGLAVLSMRISEKIPKEKNKSNQLFGILEEQFLSPLIIIFTLLIFYLLPINFSGVVLIVIFLITFFTFRFIYLKIIKNSKSILLSPLLVVFHVLSFFAFLLIVAYNLGLEEPQIAAVYYQFSTSLSLLFAGVPAGIGIREMIFYFISENLVSKEYIFLILFQTRINILICDIFFGLIGFYNIYIKK